jgi:hypothetical protein
MIRRRARRARQERRRDIVVRTPEGEASYAIAGVRYQPQSGV